MSFSINQNLLSLFIQRNIARSTDAINQASTRLSSGERITKASDDPSGLSNSQEIRYEIRGLQKNQQNVGGALSVIGVAESGMSNIQDLLQRARELTVQAGNDTLSPLDRSTIQSEVASILDEIQRTASQTTYLGRNLLDGSVANQTIQVGSGTGQSFALNISDFRVAALGQVAKATGTSVVSGAPILGGGDLTINGINVPGSGADGISSVNPNSSAIAKAKAINAVEGQTGVHATPEATQVLTAGSTISGVNLDGATRSLSINGVNIGSVVVTTGDPDDRLINAINAKTSSTGVTASHDPSGALKLTAADGRNIELTTTGSVADELGLAAADGDLTSAVTTAAVTLSSDKAYAVGGTLGLIGFGAGQASVALDPTTAITNLDISTSQAAGNSLVMIDAALRQTTQGRSALGAIQNRLTSITDGLSSRIEQLTSSDSRIRDTDFAMETARLAQAQILQQAGTALLTQANATPRTALQLLLQ